ncbi:hypothetical protein TUBRATIS_006570 [Tubulinosema ratisbonensis]|uniref:DH domain-containing protein n=1 Tax=Tubulinosema ratisbonensis TaxID=291195 RepID=A0A437APA2_9MICR|nr:hypothetical protein TUBRATIS_006570 [Tubulinosema ratisbonensis]
MVENIYEEFLESEKTYLHDLFLWNEKFKLMITHSPFILPSEKERLCSKIFYNLDEIYDLHKRINNEIFNDENNTTRDFAQVFLSKFNHFSVYEKYVHNIPMIEYFIKVEVVKNYEFFRTLQVFLEREKALNLTYTHFILRPIQKLMRYELLFKKIFSKEKNESKKNHVADLLTKFEATNFKIDEIYKLSKNYVRIFEINAFLVLESRNNICLELIHKNRKIYKEGNAKIYYEEDKRKLKVKIILFDNIILICKMVFKNNIDYLYLIDVITFLSSNFIKRTEIISIEIERDRRTFLEFDTLRICKTWFDLIESVASDSFYKIKQIEKENYKKISLNYKVDLFCDVITEIRNLKSEINDRFRSEINVAGLFYRPENETSLFSSLFKKQSYSKNTINLPFLPPESSFTNNFIFSGENKIFKKEEKHSVIIFYCQADKMIYLYKDSLFIFQSQRKVFISSFNSSTIFLNPVMLQENISNFYVYQIRDLKFLVIINNMTELYSELLIYNFDIKENQIIFSFVRKAYSGSKIDQVIGIDDMIVTVSNEIKIINAFTLLILDFLDPFDNLLPYYLNCVSEKRPKFIWQCEINRIIICYETFCIKTNRNGNLIEEKHLFSWQFTADEYNFTDKCLIIVGKKEYALLKEDNLSIFKEEEGFKICVLEDKIYLFVNNNLYLISE